MKNELVRIGELKNTEQKRDPGDLTGLKESIRECGLINPLTINQRKELMAGRRRYQAIKELGWKSVPVRVLESLNELFSFRIALIENIERKNLSDPELSAAIKEYDEMKRKTEGEKDLLLQCGKKPPHRPEELWSQEKTAKDLNISQQAVSKAIQIATAVEEYPELADKKGIEILRTLKAKKALSIPDLPKAKFNIVYADPPWQYEHSISNSRRIENQYPTLSVEEISNYVDSKGKSVLDIFADNAILFLWATNPKLMEAIMVIYSWGFEYRTNLVWIKDKMGMGYYCRGQHELLLIAKRGNYPTPESSNKPISIIEAPRTKHSEKPKEAYKIIEKMYPKGKKVELFGRKKREGWELFGQEN